MMTKLEQAARQALDALEEYRDTQMIKAPRRAITALREALAGQAKQEPSCNQHPDAPHGFARNASHNAGRYVCECEGWEPEQEPVAVVEITYGREPECYVTGNIDDFPEGVFKLYAAPVQQTEQKPVVLGTATQVLDEYFLAMSDLDSDTLIYAASVRTKDLTCQEVTALIMEGAAGGGWQGFAERIQKAFKEKNK